MGKKGAGAPGRELTAAEQRLGAILDHVADAVIVADERGRIEAVNLAAERLFGWEGDALVGRPLTVLMEHGDGESHQSHVERYLATGRSGILNVGPRMLTGVRRDGARLQIELSVGVAVIAGERRFIGACRDVSQRLAAQRTLTRTVEALRHTVAELRASTLRLEEERRQSEMLAKAAEAARADAEQANLAKSRFLATMSHEIRTPLNGVIAIADVLAGRTAEGPDRELVSIISESGRTLLSLLNEILDLAKIEAGSFALSLAPFSLDDLLAKLATTWRCVAIAKGIDLRLEARPTPPVVGDAGRLRQILSNLISNAIKFTDRGAVTLACEHRPAGPGRVSLTITVADTGDGFDSALAERIFEPFVQLDQTNTRRHTGTGLGLAICRELSQLMGGRIRAESACGAGARIILDLPMDLALPRAAPPASHAEAGAAPKVVRRARVLVADDHPLNRRILAVLLEELGVDHEACDDGAAAVERVAAEPFDLVLMDVQMPGMDGLEATRAIRRLGGAAGQVPVIAVTANAMAEQAEACRAAGMDDVLTKPVEAAALQRMLARRLEDAGRPASAA